MIKDILLVGLDNLCRSPLAHAVMSRRAPAMRLASAGLQAPEDEAPHPMVIGAARRVGLDISHHRSTPLRHHLCERADLILTMEEWQRHAILRLYPVSGKKVFRLGHMRHMDLHEPGVQNPHGLLRTTQHIHQCVNDWLPVLRVMCQMPTQPAPAP